MPPRVWNSSSSTPATAASPKRRSSATPTFRATPPRTTSCAQRASSTRKGLVAVTGNDSDNVYITLSARGLNETLQVVARTSDIANAEKLKRAGADKVISPLEIGGRRIALSAVRPLAVHIADSIFTGDRDENLQFAEISITNSSALADSTIEWITQHPDVEALGLRRADGEMIAAPHRNVVLQPGDSLFVIGVEEAIAALSGAELSARN